jgi:putative cardiolipin synthase
MCRTHFHKLIWLTVGIVLVLFAPEASAASRVRILHGDQDALQARIDLIEQARQRIDVAYYIVGDDSVPLLVLGLLREAARRGVCVRLLVDGHDGNNQMPRALQAHLIHEGIEIREYHPPGVKNPYWIKNRMHDKLLIVDGEHLITGGRNLKDEYYGHDCKNFVDRDVYIRGCAAAEADCYFSARWESGNVCDTRLGGKIKKSTLKYQTHTELNDAGDEAAIAAAECLLDEALKTARECRLAEFSTGRDWSVEATEVECVDFLHDDPCGKKTKCPGIADDMLELLDNAQCSILLETPYLVLSRQMKRVLASASRRGVQITILTNSLATNNHHSAQAAYENDKRWFLRHGIELWELSGQCVHLHAKAAVIDGCAAVIGSYNFDCLSEKRNSEVAVAIHDAEVAAELTASIGLHMQIANHIGRNRRPDGYARKYPGVDRKTIRELRVKRLAAPAIRGSL